MSDRLTPGTRIGNYELQKVLGSGSFATAWRARHVITNTIVAVKVIEKSSINSQIAKTRFLREISLLKKFDHPFIAQFYEVIEDKTFYYLCMEFIQNGNLLDYVNTNGRLSEDTARRYFEELIFVLEYMHIEKKVAHRDLKCENVLLDRYFNLKVIDFGLANVFSESNPKLLTACGSPAYAAPPPTSSYPARPPLMMKIFNHFYRRLFILNQNTPDSYLHLLLIFLLNSSVRIQHNVSPLKRSKNIHGSPWPNTSQSNKTPPISSIPKSILVNKSLSTMKSLNK